MRRLSVLFILTVLVSISCLIPSGTRGETLKEAIGAADAGDLASAIGILTGIVDSGEGDSDTWAYLGLYTGMSAGQAEDYMEAGRLTMKSFEYLDKAVELDKQNGKAYLFRGIMGVQVPDFLGRLNGGIKDLEKAAGLYAPGGPGADPGSRITALSMLATGYRKKGDVSGQRKALEKIITEAPGSDAAAKAGEELAGLPPAEVNEKEEEDLLSPSEDDTGEIASLRKAVAEKPDDPGLLLRFGTALYSAGRYGQAGDVLKRYIELDDGKVDVYRMLSMSMSMLAAPGYDENIYDDTDYRSRLAMEAMLYLDRAVALEPENLELRLTRGINGITFPYFLGKFEQGVEDLEMVASSSAPEEMRAEATYYLGLARQREAMRYWIKIAKEFKGTEAEAMVYRTMRPDINRLDLEKTEKPFLMIDFVLGFEDELAPQTAVWIEDGDGKYVCTIYVSGFAGFVLENQVTLPAWARDSGFEGVDGVTGPSINVGHHIYTWDLTDYKGKKVDEGEYTVKVETCYWPTMKYQIVESTVKTGDEGSRSVVEEGDFIPRLEVRYIK